MFHRKRCPNRPDNNYSHRCGDLQIAAVSEISEQASTESDGRQDGRVDRQKGRGIPMNVHASHFRLEV